VPPDEGERFVQRRVEWQAVEPVAVSEGVEQRMGDERVAEAAGGELEGGACVLHLDARPDGDSGALGALDELSPRGVLVTPARFGQHEGGLRELFDADRAAVPVAGCAGVDDLELRHGGADVEAVVVDRQRDQAGFQAPGAYGVRELAGVLADDADGHLRVATDEVFDEPGEQQVVGGAERPERRGSAGEGARPPHDVRGVACGSERALGFGPKQPPGVGELQAAAGADEERDAELPFLDSTPLEWADGAPLRVAGMTLPVGLERLYFVGLAAPRGPQLPVYSAQARLIAKFLTAQKRARIALSALYTRSSRPEARIDIPRHEWQGDMDRTRRRILRILRRTPERAHASQSETASPRAYLAIHG
jgi:hypothetical protein